MWVDAVPVAYGIGSIMDELIFRFQFKANRINRKNAYLLVFEDVEYVFIRWGQEL